MMNCATGDIAIITKSQAGNEGKIVRLVRPHHSETHDLDGLPFSRNHGPRWVLDRPVPSTWADSPAWTVPDVFLRPITTSIVEV